ncbi:MAG: hypothetical protein ACYTGX_07115, partial [Planctomycetota bacterium]
MQVPFEELFSTADDGTLTPRKPVRIEDRELPAGEALPLDADALRILQALAGHESLDVHQQGDMLVIDLDPPPSTVKRLDPESLRALRAMAGAP